MTINKSFFIKTLTIFSFFVISIYAQSSCNLPSYFTNSCSKVFNGNYYVSNVISTETHQYTIGNLIRYVHFIEVNDCNTEKIFVYKTYSNSFINQCKFNNQNYYIYPIKSNQITINISKTSILQKTYRSEISHVFLYPSGNTNANGNGNSPPLFSFSKAKLNENFNQITISDENPLEMIVFKKSFELFKDFDTSSQKKYSSVREGIDQDSLIKYYDNYLNGSLAPYSLYISDLYKPMNCLLEDNDFENRVFNYAYYKYKAIHKSKTAELIFKLNSMLKYLRMVIRKYQSMMVDKVISPNLFLSTLFNRNGNMSQVIKPLFRGFKTKPTNSPNTVGQYYLSNKFISTSYDIAIANEFSNGELYQIEGENECQIESYCLECRGQSYKSEKEVTIKNKIIFYMYKKEDRVVNGQTMILYFLKKHCGNRPNNILELN